MYCVHHSTRPLISSLNGHINVCNAADNGGVLLIFHERVLSVSHHMSSVNSEIMQYIVLCLIYYL